MKEAVAGNEGAGLYKWHLGLPPIAGGVADVSQSVQALNTVVDRHPFAASIKDSVQHVTGRIRELSAAAAGWQAAVRTQNAPDFEAVESPRGGSVHVESLTDVQKAQ